MQMSIIWTITFVLACLPLLMAAFFLVFTLPRKLVAVKQDLKTLTLTPGPLDTLQQAPSGKIASEEKINALAKELFGTLTVSLPALLLTLFYCAGFGLCDAYLNMHYNSGQPRFFSAKFIEATRPILYAFLGVYLFNLGTIVRRLYLADLNEQVFWGAINRLWLSMGLALVVLKSSLPLSNSESSVFLSIGFLANTFLEWVLDNALKLLNVGQPKSEDLPLQMIKGINIWKEYRLEEEGIENVQNLATADVTELTVRTHYNFRTLIDWIDQALLLIRLTSGQTKILTEQATAISAIEFASASPKATGSNSVADALAVKLNVDKVLMAATMDRLYEDEYVQDLWNLWQSGKEGGIAISSSSSKPVPSQAPAPPAAAAASAG